MSRAPGLGGPLVAGALLAILILAAFPGVFQGSVFYLRDASQNHDPARRLVTERLHSFELPLWDPYHGGGTPLYANPNMLVLHPITLLFLALPHEAAFTWSIVLQFGLLALGGYLLARRLPVSPASAFLAAAVLALSGPAASLSSMQNVLCAFAWLPLALWGWLGVVRGGGAGARLAAVLPLAVILITGEPATLLAWLLLAPVLAMTDPAGPPPRHSGAAADTRRAGHVRSLAVVFGTAVLVAGAALVPAFTLLPLTPRGAGLPVSEVFRWPLLPERLPELFLPRLFGDPTRLPPNAWWGAWLFEGSYPFLFSVFLGAIPLLCAGAALGPGPSRRRGVACAAVAGAAIGLALLPAFPGLGPVLAALPGARLLRYPERLVLLATMAIAILAALGWERLRQRRGHSRLRRLSLGLGLVLVMAAGVVAVRPEIADPVLARLMRLPAAFAAGPWMGSIRSGALQATLRAGIEVALFAASLVLLLRGAWSRAVEWGVPVLAAVSLLSAAAPARSMAPRALLETPSPLREAIDHGPGALRLHHAPRPPGLGIRGETDEQVWGYRFDRVTYALLTGHADEVPTMLDPATDRMDLALPASLGTRLPAMSGADQVRILRLTSVGTVLTYGAFDAPGLTAGPVLADLSRPEVRLYHVAAPLPRLRFVTHARPPRDPGDAASSLLDPAFDPDTEVLIDGAPHTDAPPPAEATPIQVLQDDPERVRISLVAPSSGHLVVSDCDAPGWGATLDGVPVPIRRANMLFRAVPVPAGRHTIEMRYRPFSVKVGAATSLLGFAALGALCLRGRKKAATQPVDERLAA
ncbi:MAG TPA: YfhO family protein [Candidatus Polarisedimenticolia bacterium]|nr:YfhO family protein [Candidatus Polarisedimenticolia bacterium]